MTDPQDVTLEMSDGYPVRSRWWPAESPTGAVVYLHGIQSHGGWFASSASSLAAAGLAVLLPDRRGSGRNARQRGHAPSAWRLLDDVREQVEWVRRQAGQIRVHLIGVSWGGKLALCAQQQAPDHVASLTLVAPGLFPRVDLALGTRLAVAAARAFSPRRLFAIPLDDAELFTVNPDRIEYIRRDPDRLRAATASFLFASRALDRIARRSARGPATRLHMFLAEHDRIIDNKRTRNWVRGLPWPTRYITEYKTAHHTLEFEPCPDEFFRDLVDAVNGALAP